MSAESNVTWERFLLDLMGLGRQDAYASKTESGYLAVREKPGENLIQPHLSNSKPIGIYPLVRSGTRIAVLDLDNHDGSFTWERAAEIARTIRDRLVEDGLKPFQFRSGGGAGIHIWLVWASEQPASDVRKYLARVLARAGLRSGSRGMANGEAEIFPKQDQVAIDGLGSLIALPLARASRPLSSGLFTPYSMNGSTVPNLERFYNSDLPDVSEQRTRTRDAAPLEGDEKEVKAALRHISADPYDIWVLVGLVLKHAFGDEPGFALWHEWSSCAAAAYKGEADCRTKWSSLKPTGAAGLGTLFRLAKEGGWNGPKNSVVREMNSKYGILTYGNRTQIIIKEPGDTDDIEWLAKNVFFDRLISDRIPKTADDGSTEWLPKAPYWFSHRKAARYDRVDFDPSSPPGHNGSTWNLWTGFALEPQPGDWSLLRQHIVENICASNSEMAEWLLNWMAFVVQKPAVVIGTVPVFMGAPGTGKGFLAHRFGRLWGRHYLPVSNAAHLVGKFNAHFAGRRLVFVDECTFGGNRREAGVLKTIVTEPWLTLERKGVDAIRLRNRLAFMIASNEQSVVPADLADRRWMIFQVSENRREDQDFFGSVESQLENGGYAGLLFDLLNRDISAGPNPQRIIKGSGLFRQIIEAQKADVRYLHQILDEGRLPQNTVAGPRASTVKALWIELQATQADAKWITSVRVGRFVREVIPEVTGRQNGTYLRQEGDLESGERSTQLNFPKLSLCRTRFEKYVGQPVPWTNDLDDWVGDPMWERQEDCPI